MSSRNLLFPRVTLDKCGFLLETDCLNSILPDNRHQEAKVPVAIRVLDVNDNAPKFAAPYEGFICESDQTKPLSNQVIVLSPFPAMGKAFGNRVWFLDYHLEVPPTAQESFRAPV